MTNNILKEIKNELISKGTEPNIDNFEQYISQNKIFSILFISKIIPELSSLLESLNDLCLKNESIKLLICICSDSKADFEEILFLIKDNISCLIFNYESKNRDIIIYKYNIISIPTMIILDKDGELIDTLNYNRINELNEYDVKGWENKFMIKKMNKTKKLELGDTCILAVHRHELVYSDNEMKGYSGSGWSCDVCRKHYNASTPNFNCIICGWDLCDACYEINKIE